MSEQPVALFVTGTAGAGKSTFSLSFKDWMIKHRYNATIVNMDPGVETADESTFDVDIRDWIHISEIMDEYSLGPNGAQIVAADMIAIHIDEIKEEIDKLNSDYVIVDTPGQMELFSFREASSNIVNKIGEKHSAICFVMDPFIAKFPSMFTAVRMISLLIEFRFGLPTLNLLSKVDLITEDVENRISKWMEEPEQVYNEMLTESPTMNRELAMSLLRLFNEIDISSTLFKVSGIDQTGFGEVYGMIQSIFMGGEDLEKM